jgi:hypothetical protein
MPHSMRNLLPEGPTYMVLLLAGQEREVLVAVGRAVVYVLVVVAVVGEVVVLMVVGWVEEVVLLVLVVSEALPVEDEPGALTWGGELKANGLVCVSTVRGAPKYSYSTWRVLICLLLEI